ncbi:unnamed protein product [Linum tenue]|uniref:Uncharacterized protein n=2 Tax=Linum tenue TaxID=586396 RepID=A0AAV0L5P4_9ROSI|nr:unnamed protein product [Linum tenue]
MKIRFIRIPKTSRKPRLILKQLPAWTTPDAGPDLLLSVQRHVEAKTVEQLDSAQVMQLERNLQSLLGEAQVRKTELMIEAVTSFQQQEMPLPPESLLMENELSAITNQQSQNQNQQHEQELDAIPNPNQQQQLFLMGMHLNNSNNGGDGDSNIVPIQQLQHHQQNQPFLMGMHLNHDNPSTTNHNNTNSSISNGGAGSGPSVASLLQRDAFQKGILHFF